MAKCLVIKSSEGWKEGDHVEAFGDRLKELVDVGVVVVEVADVKEVEKLEVAEVKEEVVAPVEKKRGRPSKGVK